MSSPWSTRAVLAATLLGGVAVRAVDLAGAPLTTDEAETAINALTIVDTGLPRDRYAGQPVFENTLVRPWPGSAEYEFRDLSYSDRGLAVYHGWLPLYATAASLAAAGVTPDPAPRPDDGARPRHGRDEMVRRTLAARAPSVLFGALFILAAWGTGRAALGRDAGLTAAALAAFAWPCVRVARQARYYSATLAVSTLCCLAVWRLGQRGRARDAALLALALVLLFHTHAVTFAGACAVSAVWLPLRLRGRPGAARALGVLVGLTGLGVAPWLVLTGALEALPAAPAARDLLTAGDALDYVRYHGGLLGLLSVAGLGLLGARSARLAARLSRPAAVLGLWVTAVAAAFVALAPAASFYLWRSALGLAGPTVALAAALGCAAARALRLPRWTPLLAAPPLLAHTALSLAAAAPWAPVLEAVQHLRDAALAPAARLYASPDQHLALTLYTGLPVQSIAPVRREFLDAHPGEVVYIDAAAPSVGVDPAVIEASARAAGVQVSPAEAAALSRRLRSRLLREDVARAAASVTPALEPLPAFLTDALRRARGLAGPRPGQDLRWQNPAIYRGHETHTRRGAWQAFFYRFVDPVRRADDANYAARVRDARATVLPSGWVVYHSPPRTPERRSAP